MEKSLNKLEAVHSFVVMPKDCNFNSNINNGKNDTLFGGKLLYELDFAGAKVARRATYDIKSDMVVTASTDRVDFSKSSYLGDIITMVATIKAFGTTSIQIRVKVRRESLKGYIEQVCSANMVFVTMKDGNPFSHGLSFEKIMNK